jgi:16S rRNA (guanine(1405)-N(7))-methyltransferase
MSTDGRVDELVGRVCASTKYASIHRGLVARLAAEELAAGRSMKEAVKSTRRRLHQVSAVYVEAAPHYDRWLGLLREAHTSENPEQVRQVCRTIMATHQSSRERLPILEAFYADLLGGLGPITSVLDLACGLNPLAIPWMPLAVGAHYVARDVYSDQMAFLSQALVLLGVEGDAGTGDVLADEPGPPVQVAFLLKSVPCLEQIDRFAGERLIAGVPARYVVVSFPTASLGGRRDRGMLATYRSRMQAICQEHPWSVREHLYDSELAYLVDKSGGDTGMEKE